MVVTEQKKKKKPNPLESLVSLRNQNPSLPAADKHPYKAAVTTATAKPLIKDIRAGLAPIPIALSLIGLNWSAQVNFVQGVEKPKPSGSLCAAAGTGPRGCPRGAVSVCCVAKGNREVLRCCSQTCLNRPRFKHRLGRPCRTLPAAEPGCY